MKRHELLANPGYWQNKIQIDLYNQIQDYMDEHGLNRTQLADKLGVSKGYVSQIMNGDYDHKISKLIDLSLKIGKIPFVHWKSMSRVIYEDTHSINKTVSLHTASVTLMDSFGEGGFYQGYYGFDKSVSGRTTVEVEILGKEIAYAN